MLYNKIMWIYSLCIYDATLYMYKIFLVSYFLKFIILLKNKCTLLIIIPVLHEILQVFSDANDMHKSIDIQQIYYVNNVMLFDN